MIILLFIIIPVRDIILPILAKHYAYFNDNDAFWVPFTSESLRLKAYYLIYGFFKQGLNKTPNEIISFLNQSPWSSTIIYECLERGDYKNTIWMTDLYGYFDEEKSKI